MHHTMTELRLDRYYEDESFDDLGDMAGSLLLRHEDGGPDAVSEHLHDVAISARDNRESENYWRAALYFRLADSREFCEVGFRQLLPELS